jgi:PAS domain S-box-containing protein
MTFARASGAVRGRLARFVSRWVLLALAFELVLTVVDAAAERSVIAPAVILLPVLGVALVETGERTAVVAAGAVPFALASGLWDQNLSTSNYVYRVLVVAGGSVLAVAGAIARTRAVRAGERIELLAEIARIGDTRGSLEETLRRVAELLVPAVADMCGILIVDEDGSMRRAVAKVAGGSEELERRMLARPMDERASELTHSARDLADALLIRRVGSEHVAELAADDRDRGLIDALGMTSLIHAPMRASGETLAVLTLGVGPSGRRFGSDDLRFARVVASRAALATQNVRLKQDVHEADQRMRAIIGSLAEAVTIRDLSGRIVYANDAALASMGFASVEEIRERPPQSIIEEYIVTDEDGEPVPMDRIPSVRLLAGEPAEPLLIRVVDPRTGDERWSLLKTTPLYDARGTMDSAVTIIEDVTQVKRSELQTSFLSRASEILASSLDYEETLCNVAWLAVPEIADWCAVDLIDEQGRRQQVVAAHRDPDKLALAGRLREYEPPELDPSRGLGAVVRTGKSELYHDIAPEMLRAAAVDDEHLRLMLDLGLRSALVIPMRAGSRVVGAMTLVTAESARRFTEEDLVFAEQIAARAAVAVENARLATSRRQIAETLQRSLLPDVVPSISGWEVATMYRPAGAGREVEVGGDFYDFVRTPSGWVVLLGDVTGKGVEAAAMTALVRHRARFVGRYEDRPSQIIASLHESLREQSGLSLCTALCVRLADDHVVVSCAGHPPPLLVREDGRIREIGTQGPILGAWPDSDWVDRTMPLEADETLFVYTDGVVDTLGKMGRFGTHRLRRVLIEHASRPPERMLRALEAELADFQLEGQSDDTAALALRLVPDADSRRSDQGRTPSAVRKLHTG